METPSADVPGRRYLNQEAARWLAGLETAVLAAFAGGGWFCLAAWLRGEYWWAPLNVWGALFYGDRAFQLGFGRATLAGGALLLILYTLLGLLLARAVPAPVRFTRVLLVGLAGALLWQAVADRLFWTRLHPFAPAYFPRSVTLPAHILFALALTRLGRSFRRLAAALCPPPPPVPAAEQPVEFLLPAEEDHSDQDAAPGPVSSEPEPDSSAPDRSASAVPAADGGSQPPSRDEPAGSGPA